MVRIGATEVLVTVVGKKEALQQNFPLTVNYRKRPTQPAVSPVVS